MILPMYVIGSERDEKIHFYVDLSDVTVIFNKVEQGCHILEQKCKSLMEIM